jgi:hypothetical protein
VSLREAWERYSADTDNIIAAKIEELSVQALWAIQLNCFDWSLFWSARHPDERVRAMFARELEQAGEGLERVGAKAKEILKRRGLPQ